MRSWAVRLTCPDCKTQQRTTPVSSHLDQTGVVKDGFIIRSKREREIPSRQDGPTRTLLVGLVAVPE